MLRLPILIQHKYIRFASERGKKIITVERQFSGDFGTSNFKLSPLGVPTLMVPCEH